MFHGRITLTKDELKHKRSRGIAVAVKTSIPSFHLVQCQSFFILLTG